MTSVNELFRKIVERVALRYGGHVEFQFGDWDYIADVLQTMSSCIETSGKRYPIVCLRSPFTEHRYGRQCSVTLEFLIAVNTLKEYTNEQREATSFAEVLRPVYSFFIEEIAKDKHIKSSYAGLPEHDYIENYRYGRIGVQGGDGNRFRDFIDAVEIKNLKLTIKEIKCYE